MKNCHSKIPLFLRYYSDYLAADSHFKNIGSEATPSMFDDYRHSLDNLSSELMALRKENKADGYLLYLLGVMSVKLEQYELAVEMLLESIAKVPLNWHAWMQLSDLIVDRVKVSKIYCVRMLFINYYLLIELIIYSYLNWNYPITG